MTSLDAIWGIRSIDWKEPSNTSAKVQYCTTSVICCKVQYGLSEQNLFLISAFAFDCGLQFQSYLKLILSLTLTLTPPRLLVYSTYSQQWWQPTLWETLLTIRSTCFLICSHLPRSSARFNKPRLNTPSVCFVRNAFHGFRGNKVTFPSAEVFYCESVEDCIKAKKKKNNDRNELI